MGHNKIGLLGKSLFSTLDADGRRITNTSVRKYVVSSLQDADISDDTIIHYTGHANTQSLKHYDQLTSKRARKITDTLISSQISQVTKSSEIEEVETPVTTPAKVDLMSPNRPPKTQTKQCPATASSPQYMMQGNKLDNCNISFNFYQ